MRRSSRRSSPRRAAYPSWLFWLAGKYMQGRGQARAGSSLWLAVLGILIGVATLIAVLTGMSGLQSLLTDAIDELTAYHLQVAVTNAEDSRHLRRYLAEQPGVINVTPYREAPMLLGTLLRGNANQPVVGIVRAVETEDFMRDQGRAEVMQVLGPILDSDLANPGHIWIGRSFAYENALSEGDFIQLISADHRAGQIQTQQHQFLVSATYQLGNPNIEKNYLFIGQSPLTESLFSGSEYYLGVKLAAKSQAQTLKRRLQADLQQQQQRGQIAVFRLRSGREANQAFFNALRTEKSFLQFLVSLIFLLVAFQIFQSMRRTVYTRIPELMLLRALGASGTHIRTLFLLEGLLIGLLGVALGVTLGLVLSKNMNEILWWISTMLFQVPGLLPHIATAISWQDLAVVAGSALVFSSAAGWLASGQLLRVRPIEVLRSE